jgi:2-keto-3-deoxy-6-phosphogluconate aldolase
VYNQFLKLHLRRQSNMQNKLYVYEKALESRVVAIMRKFDVTKVVPLARALYEGGIRAMEVTMDTVGATGAITAIRNELGDKIAVGAGTVLDGEIARIAILAGAQFLVTPNLNLDVVTVGNRYGVPAPCCVLGVLRTTIVTFRLNSLPRHPAAISINTQ